MNLLKDALFLVEIDHPRGAAGAFGKVAYAGAQELTLPQVLEALAADRVGSFPRLRPHQRPYWHMFLTQLAAMALSQGKASSKAKSVTPDEAGREALARLTAADWTSLIENLTPEFKANEPWMLLQEDTGKPGFLQPPLAGTHAKAPAIETSPDAIDLPSTARSHSQKAQAVRGASPEHWIHALVCRQTAGGYAGKSNWGVMRAPGAFHPRVSCSLTPSLKPGAWFQRDVLALLATKSDILAQYSFLDGGHKLPLLWTRPWDGQSQIPVGDIGPWTIEICQRLRLKRVHDSVAGSDRLVCERRLSESRRIAEGLSKTQSLLGRIGCPWSPIFVEVGSSAKLEGGKPGLEWTARLMFDEKRYKLPPLAQRIDAIDGDEPMHLVIRGVHGHDGKTSWSERMVLLPARRRFSWGQFSDQDQENPALSMLADIGLCHSDVLMPAMFAWFEAGDVKIAPAKAQEIRRDWYVHIRDAFSEATDASFFACAFDAMEDFEGSQARWRNVLRAACREAFDAFLERAPKHQETWRPKRARALGALEALIAEKLPELPEPKTSLTAAESAAAQGLNQVTTPTRKQQIAEATRKIYGLLSAGNMPADQLATLADLDLHDMAGKMPQAFWRILGHSIPVEMQEECETMERSNWAALIRIIAQGVKTGQQGGKTAIGRAMREAGFNERRFFHMVASPSREDMRLTLADTARQLMEKRISFSYEEAAELLLLDYPDRDQALEKLDRDWNMWRGAEKDAA